MAVVDELIPSTCSLNCFCHSPQVVTGAVREEKRSQMDVGDLSEDE